MNWPPPAFLRDAAKVALDQTGTNHYAIPKGLKRLRVAISKHYSASYELPGGRDLDPETEVLVTAGANEGAFIFFPLSSCQN